MNRCESLLTGLLESFRRLVITALIGPSLESFNRVCRVQGFLGLWERFELVGGRPHPFRSRNLAFFALLSRPNLWKEAGPMNVERGIQVFLRNGIEKRRPAWGNVGMAKQLAPHGPVFPVG